ncbi:MAG: uracil-DNA glycosylase family protein [Bacteroidales bacterium]|nr:hypothetical protein [Bacteroidales bacterium]
MEAIVSCKRCDLCKNQTPLIQECSKADIFWVGLSAVKISDGQDIPLSPNTNTGKLIHSIEFFFQNKSFYKTNLVKCLPLANNKIRYPSAKEMTCCVSHLKDEIQSFKPKLIFLLGKQVATFVLREFGVMDYTLDEDFDYSSYSFGNTLFVPIHHPSFILVYKRKRLQEYIKSVEKIIGETEDKEICAPLIIPILISHLEIRDSIGLDVCRL